MNKNLPTMEYNGEQRKNVPKNKHNTISSTLNI